MHPAGAVGYHAALIDKLDADRLVGLHTSGAAFEYIMYYDSDNLLTRPLRPSDIFELRLSDVGPGQNASRYLLRLPAIAWRRFGAMHEAAWRSRLATMLGLPNKDVRFSTMARGGGLTYPTWMHAGLREHLNGTLGMSLHEQAARLLAEPRTHDHMAADYELMGGYLFYVLGGGGVAWEVEDGSLEHPWSNETHRGDGTLGLPFPVLQQNSWAANGFTLDKRLEYECILGASVSLASEYDDWRWGIRTGRRVGKIDSHVAFAGWCDGLRAFSEHRYTAGEKDEQGGRVQEIKR